MIDNFDKEPVESTSEEIVAIASELTTANLNATDLNSLNEANPDADLDLSEVPVDMVGDQAVGGTAPTANQDLVDELGAAAGIEMNDRAFLRTTEMLEDRDNRRWELEPESSEDHQ
jgi:hypothetical protein